MKDKRPEVITAREAGDESIETEMLLGKQVFIEDRAVVINVMYPYKIPLTVCDTHASILRWVVQLCGKTWITPTILRRFIYLTTSHHKLEIKN